MFFLDPTPKSYVLFLNISALNLKSAAYYLRREIPMSSKIRAALAAVLAFAVLFPAYSADLWYSDKVFLRQVDTATNQITLSVPFKDADDAQALTLV